MVVFIVHSEDYDVDEIQLKCLLSGNSFTSADAARDRIEKQLRQKQKVYVFRDFKKYVQKAKCEVIQMELKDFQY